MNQIDDAKPARQRNWREQEEMLPSQVKFHRRRPLRLGVEGLEIIYGLTKLEIKIYLLARNRTTTKKILNYSSRRFKCKQNSKQIKYFSTHTCK